MKIREIEAPTSPSKPALPTPPDFSSLMEKGLIPGIEIDPADQIKQSKSRFSQSSSLSSIPEAQMTSENDGWTRQEVPSLGIPYGISHLWVRPLTVSMLAKVHAAQAEGMKEGRNQRALTMLIDALAPTIKDFDIRNLTVPDWHSHLYWLRINSYPNRPITVPWTSRYGNENVTRINSTSFEFEELAMSRAEYLEWQKKSITFPTVRDMELLSAPDLSEEDRWTITYAQYIYVDEPPSPNLMKTKIELFNALGVEQVALINEFSELCSHGVIEQITVRDEKFDLDRAIDYIGKEVAAMTSILEQALDNSGDDDVKPFISLMNQTELRANELKMLKKVKENNGLTENGLRFSPEKEVVALATANATLLFP